MNRRHCHRKPETTPNAPRGLGVACLLAVVLAPAGADTLHVPGEYPTIGDATAVAEPGDTVLVGPGWYSEEVRIPDRVSVISEAGAGETVVYGDDPLSSVAVFLPPGETGPNTQTRIKGFRLSHQEAFSDPTIVCDNPYAVVEHCRIYNAGDGGDGGVAVDLRKGGTIRHCSLETDTEGSVIATGDSARALIEDNVIRGNAVVPIQNEFGSGSETVFKNNTFDNPTIVPEVILGGTDFAIVFINNIFYFQVPACGSNPPDSLFFDYNCQWPPGEDGCDPGEHSFTADPLFCTEEGKEWWLTPESPCLGTGRNGDDVGARWGICGVTGLEDTSGRTGLTRFRVFPNPASGRISIVLDTPARERATARVIDIRGRLLRTVTIEAGAREVHWDSRFNGDRLAPAGTYFLILTVNGRSLTRRAVLMR